MPDPRAASPVPPATVPVGQRFELLKRIGAGNHGVVFRARDRQLQREVAIKRFSHFVADDPRAMRRITREVATLARVSHPHVVTVHDLVHMADGDGEVTPHLVMELVEGTSLRDLLATQGPSLRSVIVVRGVLEGLAACHQAGILHLDIKPANVLVTPGGAIKIVDFGIARAASDATATVAGTPHYMAPEQFDGRSDERSDIYSVGCLLYESLTGRPPFAGTMATQLMAHRNEPRPDPRAYAPEVSPSLSAVVQRAMAIDPDQRYQGVAQMLDGLAAADLSPAAAPAAPAPGPAIAPAAATPAGPLATGWDRLQSYATGLALSAFIIALLPGLVWVTLAFVPLDYRPSAWDDTHAGDWWAVAAVIAVIHLLVRRRGFFAAISGPDKGTAMSPRRVDRPMRSGLRMAAGAGLRGSIPMLAPWYVLLVAGIAEASGIKWPDDVFSAWGVAWLLMPLAAAMLGFRAITRLRPRFGAALKSTTYAVGAAAAVLLFAVYPLAA
ncbi:serine/threonine-protein kinase [Aeromicrobium sp. A1-2]|uniref:serine/threonine-protein kinase n=1 Tax=Aeromicrobium sp. A1-2 TaxID=2107713 RepID=UPI0013C2A159|nr:serine/threonine-protein kinase [Aeromicrobium sp. A1-2]